MHVSTIAQLRMRTEAARQRYETERAKLFRADGSKFYSDAEHDERVAALRNERNAALREIERETDEELASARADLTALENGAPTALLTTAELERANARRALVLDDVAGLRNDELVNRLEAVLHGGDRDSMFVYLQAGRRRVHELRGKLGAKPGEGTGVEVPPELSRVLDDLAEKLVPESRKRELEVTRLRIEEAGEMRDTVYLALRDQTSFYAPNYAVTGR